MIQGFGIIIQVFFPLLCEVRLEVILGIDKKKNTATHIFVCQLFLCVVCVLCGRVREANFWDYRSDRSNYHLSLRDLT